MSLRQQSSMESFSFTLLGGALLGGALLRGSLSQGAFLRSSLLSSEVCSSLLLGGSLLGCSLLGSLLLGGSLLGGSLIGGALLDSGDFGGDTLGLSRLFFGQALCHGRALERLLLCPLDFCCLLPCCVLFSGSVNITLS